MEIIPKNNRWTFIERIGKKALCKCECGKEKEIYLHHYKDGSSKSCGCLQKEKVSKAKKIHGLAYNKFYYTWQSIRQRCSNNPSNAKNKPYYYDKGIIVEWKTFQEFKDDMYEEFLEHEKKYGGQNTTIERLQNNKNYCKENCVWATRKEQANNKG